MSNEKMVWLATRTFTNEHIGKALTEDELMERKEWETEYQDEIKEVSKIVDFSEYFKALGFKHRVVIASSLIENLKRAKDINMEIEDALKGNLKFCINDLDVANKMMRILSEAKQIHYETLAMLDTLIKDGNIQPNEISLLNKNMLNLKKYIIDILEKVKEKIQIDDYTGINVNKPNTFTYVDGKEENKPRKK